MKRLYLFTLPLFLCLFFVNVPPAQAHILVTDGSMGAVLHVDPDDNPEANQQATLYFDFKDSQSSFNASLCNCRLIIKNGSETVYNQPLTLTEQGSGQSSAALPYIFPAAGVYQATVTGSPVSGSIFTPFSLTYDVRVSGAPGNIAINWPLWLHHSIFIVGVLIFVGLLLYNKYREHRT